MQAKNNHIGKFWVFTSYTKITLTELPDFLTYIVFGEEYTKEGRFHEQGYLESKDKLRASTLTNKFTKLICGGIQPDIHFEPRYPKSNGEYNMKYCKKGLQSHEEFEEFKEKGPNYGKGAVITELGTCSLSFSGKRNDLIHARETIKKGVGIDEAIAGGMLTTAGELKTFQSLLPYCEPKRQLINPPTVICHWGISGSGKTHDAKIICPNAYRAKITRGGFWLGYDGQKEVIFDDFRSQHIEYVELLQILDKDDYKVNCKFGSRELQAHTFIFTCQKHPKDWYPELRKNEDPRQLLRRFTEIKEYTQMRPEVEMLLKSRGEFTLQSDPEENCFSRV